MNSSPAVSRRTIALALLTAQNSAVALTTRYSRSPADSSVAVYCPAVAVFSAEIIKASISLSMLVWERRRVAKGKEGKGGVLSQASRALAGLFAHQKLEMLKLAVPAALYALQNTLLYTALSNLDAATYQTTYQLKLLTTAIFSILFFRRSLSWVKWFSLFLLTVGVAIVQLESTTSSTSSSSSSKRRYDTGPQDPRKGFIAIFAACISSGLAGAWFERVLKAAAPAPPANATSPALASPISASPSIPKSPKLPSLRLRTNSPSLWERNLQLAVPSLLFSLYGVFLAKDLQLDQEHGLLALVASVWAGFTPLVWGVVLNQAMGGLLVALVVREASSIDKGFATSIAIVISTLASALLLGLVPSLYFVAGATLVISSTVLYSLDKE
ncbi:hypothetical protein JCM1841_001919 [Sporobolomyces salmonicolor]